MSDDAMKALADRMEEHVLLMANTGTDLSMKNWNTVSNDILLAARTLRAALVPPAEPTFRKIHPSEITFGPCTAPPADDEVEAIRARLALDTGSRWDFGQSHTDRATLLRHVDRLSAELARERERRGEADMFWDYYDPEQPYYSVEELIQEREYEGEGIVQVQEAIRCPDAAYIYRITNDPETDDREIVLERLSDADHVHYRAAMAVASGAREMWGVMVDRLAAQLFAENPAPLPERMHTCQWKNLDWHYRKHHRSLAHDRLAATLTKD